MFTVKCRMYADAMYKNLLTSNMIDTGKLIQCIIDVNRHLCMLYDVSFALVPFSRVDRIRAVTGVTAGQGCPQDVKSQDRDETETFNLQDRDETFQKTSRDRDARPRRSKKRIKTAVSQFKNTN